MQRFILLLVAMFAGAPTASAWPPTIGPELAFQNKETNAAWTSRYDEGALSPQWQVPTVDGELRQAIAFRDDIMKHCDGCKLTVTLGKFGLEQSRIEFPNGFWLNVSVDPGIVELQTAPLTEERYRELATFIEESIYGTAKRLKMTHVPEDGHLNFGAKATFETPVVLAAFMLDQINHPELGLGVLGQDILNGPPLAIQELDQIKKFFSIMDDVSAGKVDSVRRLADRVNNEVYYRSGEDLSRAAGRHYQGVSVKRLSTPEFQTQDQPVEIRWAAGQPTFQRVLLIYKLYTQRIAYLKARGDMSNYQRQLFKNPIGMTAPEKLTRFFIFVNEMGGDFNEYKELISAKRIAQATLDPIASGAFDWNKRDTFSRLVRYLPDVETSDWVRERFSTILADAATPDDIKERLRSAFIEQVTRADISMGNRRAMVEFQKELLPEERWPLRPVGPAGAPCGDAAGALARAVLDPR